VHISRIVTVDAAGVVIERLGDSYTASNGSTLVDLLHHVVLSIDKVIFVDAVHSVLIRDEAGLTRVAVAAHVHSAANLTIVMTSGSVDGASLICNLVLSHPLEGVQVPATVAAVVIGLTRDENLRGDVDIGPGCLSLDLDSV